MSPTLGPRLLGVGIKAQQIPFVFWVVSTPDSSRVSALILEVQFANAESLKNKNPEVL